MSQHTVKLPCSLDAVVTHLIGADQRILTDQSKNAKRDRMAALAARVTLRVGDQDITALNDEQKDAFFSALPIADRKQLLIAARFASYPGEEVFSFTYKYKPEGGNQQLDYVVDVPIGDGFAMRPMHKWDADVWQEFAKTRPNLKKVREFLSGLPSMDVQSWSEVLLNKHIEVRDLPVSGMSVRFTVLDGNGVLVATGLKRDEQSSHAPLMVRNLERYDGSKWIRMRATDIDNMPVADIDIVRLVVKSVEGQVDTELIFDHPEAEYKAPGEREVMTDLLTEMAFFFPSEVI